MKPFRSLLRLEGTLQALSSRLSFPKEARLSRASEFRRVKEAGRSHQGRFMILSVLPIPGQVRIRTGIITSRRIGGAVERNAVRRRLREIIRHAAPRLQPAHWLVLIARRGAVSASFAELQQDCLRLAARAMLLLPQ